MSKLTVSNKERLLALPLAMLWFGLFVFFSLIYWVTQRLKKRRGVSDDE